MTHSHNKYLRLLPLLIALCTSFALHSQTPTLQQLLADSLTNYGKKYASVGRVTIKKIRPYKRSKKLIITTNDALSYLPLRPQNVDSLYLIAKYFTQETYPHYGIQIVSNGRELSKLIPGAFRPLQKSPFKRFKVETATHPLVTNISQPHHITQGMQKRHIALWQSHGKYYNQKNQQWLWQRPVLFQTVEDLYTQAYVLPFLVPMLENAGANVLLPRERDTQRHEIIVDSHQSTGASYFLIQENKQKWKKGTLKGFAHLQTTYKEDENPFEMGSYWETKTTNKASKQITAKWIPDIPESGEYAVYIAYKSLPNSTQDALYSVQHSGGTTNFKVNQTMGGGTWIYLGTFYFDKGVDKQRAISLSNLSQQKGKIITADAIKIGGGMGNIARKPADKIVKKRIRLKNRRGKRRYRTKTTVIKYDNYTTSQAPRFVEGARYWLQWAGVPDSVYSRTEGKDDYSDDFQSRGFWVNYLAGGSSVLPQQEGLHIPIDMAIALHSDAGIHPRDSTIGTLAIFTVKNNDKKSYYKNRISRWNAREYTDLIQTQIVNDIQKTFKKEWNRRGLWNRSYSESRIPEVPTMLLEILSHQNFKDMQFGHDPRFRFVVSRAIYKGMLRYLALAHQTDAIVQPLPIHAFSTSFVGTSTVQLTWRPTIDPLEPTAQPNGYIVYTREGEGGFDNGVWVKEPIYQRSIQQGKVYSFKVEATNEGGKSFPSEILSVCQQPNNSPTVLIVNGFTKIAAPASFIQKEDEVAGFNTIIDAGVPYLSDISYTGEQTEFRRYRPYRNHENVGFGKSDTTYQHQVIRGNTFDYPHIHGTSIAKAGYSYVSTSKQALEEERVELTRYPIVDVILGKEKQTTHLLDSTKREFKAISPKIRDLLTQYTQSGGNLIISGANVIYDLFTDPKSSNSDREFVQNVLKAKWQIDKVHNIDNVTLQPIPKNDSTKTTFSFYALPNDTCYFVEAPDIIEPTDKQAHRLLQYTESGKGAGLLYKESYGIALFGFPFETIKKERQRNKLMQITLDFLSQKK